MSRFNQELKLPEFEKEFNRLRKKFRTLDEDLENFIKTHLKAFHKLGIDNRGSRLLDGLDIEYPKIYKAGKFACRSLKGRGADSGIRIIYAYYEKEDKIEFIEIYFKAEKAKEDRDRIKRYYK